MSPGPIKFQVSGIGDRLFGVLGSVGWPFSAVLQSYIRRNQGVKFQPGLDKARRYFIGDSAPAVIAGAV